MRHTLVRSLAGSSLLLFGLAAQAQYPRFTDRYDTYSDQAGLRDAQTLFQQVRNDLDRADRHDFPGLGGDRWRFSRAQGELNDLQIQWDENRYSPRQVDDVIFALQRVLNDNRLSPRDRDILAGDLSRMRDFRDAYE